jgi:lysyl-tRNA synthetase class 2
LSELGSNASVRGRAWIRVDVGSSRGSIVISPSLAEVTFSFGDDGLTKSTQAGLILLGGFLVSFVLIRISTRLMRSPKVPWWPGSIETGGLHIHHLVFGIVMMLLFGFLAIAVPLGGAGLDVVAAGFGVGAGLTLDEYALWLHLEDVYWAEEGRSSVDAVIVAAVVAGLILLGARPLSGSDTSSVVGIVIAIVVVVGLSLGALLKGRVWLGIVGLVFPPLALVGVVRLARPTSPWARRRYPADSRRMQRATVRAERRVRRYRRWQDRIAGAPSVLAPGGRPPSAEAAVRAEDGGEGVGHGDGSAGVGPADGRATEPDTGVARPDEPIDVSAG